MVVGGGLAGICAMTVQSSEQRTENSKQFRFVYRKRAADGERGGLIWSAMRVAVGDVPPGIEAAGDVGIWKNEGIRSHRGLLRRQMLDDRSLASPAARREGMAVFARSEGGQT